MFEFISKFNPTQVSADSCFQEPLFDRPSSNIITTLRHSLHENSVFLQIKKNCFIFYCIHKSTAQEIKNIPKVFQKTVNLDLRTAFKRRKRGRINILCITNLKSQKKTSLKALLLPQQSTKPSILTGDHTWKVFFLCIFPRLIREEEKKGKTNKKISGNKGNAIKSHAGIQTKFDEGG